MTFDLNDPSLFGVTTVSVFSSETITIACGSVFPSMVILSSVVTDSSSGAETERERGNFWEGFSSVVFSGGAVSSEGTGF